MLRQLSSCCSVTVCVMLKGVGVNESLTTGKKAMCVGGWEGLRTGPVFDSTCAVKKRFIKIFKVSPRLSHVSFSQTIYVPQPIVIFAHWPVSLHLCFLISV